MYVSASLIVVSLLVQGIAAQGDPSIVSATNGGTFNILHSPNQLEKASVIEILIIPGSALDNASYTNINDRYNCGDYAVTFEIPDPDDTLTVLMTISISGGLTTDDNAECNVDWGDGMSDTVTMDDPTMEQDHTYAEYGVYAVILSCNDDINGATGCPSNNPSCVTTFPFFDGVYKTVSSPMKFFVTDALVLKSFMELDLSCGPQPPIIIWRLTRIDTNITTEINITQPENSVLRFDPEVLDAGDYLAYLEVAHVHKGTQFWIEDYMFIKMALPELIPIIDGGDKRMVTHGETIHINATRSLDPVTKLESVLNQTLVKTWSFAYYTGTPYLLDSFLKGFPISVSLPTLPTPVKKDIQNGTDDVLEVDTSMFALNSWAIIMFSMTRGDRSSSTVQAIKFVTNALPVSISCVYNCNPGRERKFNYDKIELDSTFPDGFDLTDLTFTWAMHYEFVGLWLIASITTTTGLTSASLDILTASLTQGTAYRIRLTVSAPGYTDTQVAIFGTVNYLPYGGTCTMDTLTGEAARTWFIFTCSGWKGVDDRRNKVLLDDTNPMLTITVNQFTTGALVEEEPVLLTRSQKSHLILKLGDPNAAYATTLKVRVTDLYKNYREIPLTVTANPAFAWDAVTPDGNGSAIITSYTTVDYVYDEKQLLDMGKVDLIVPLVSSVCSHIHLINLPQWEPLVPRVLNAGGSIMDLNPAGNTEVESLDSVVEEASTVIYDPATLALMEIYPLPLVLNGGDATATPILLGTKKYRRRFSVTYIICCLVCVMYLNPVDTIEVESLDSLVEEASTVIYDPATLALMEVMQNMTNVIRNSVEKYLVNGSRRNDKFLGSILTNAFTNLAARHEYVNFETKVDMIFVSEFVGTASLDFKENSTVDESAQIETSTGEVYYMSQAIVNNVVPNNLRQFRQVGDLKAGRTQVGNMIRVTGKNISLLDTNMSPSERAQLYLTMQYNLQNDLDSKKQAAKDAAALALKMFKDAQDKLRICALCTNQGSDKTDQLVVKNLAANVTKSTYTTQKSTFRLDGLSHAVGYGNDTARTSVSAVEFTENVFMYDDDQRSSLVTSNVLHIDVKASDIRLTPGFMTFDQTVITPEATSILPLVDEEDASHFSLHTFIYQTNTDNVCIIAKPHNLTLLTYYDVYIRYTAAPTILIYNVKVTVYKAYGWMTCVTSDKMQGHTGLTYLAVQTPPEVVNVRYNFTLVTVGCVVWEEGINKWHTDKCSMEWFPDEDKIRCFCTELTDLTVANTFFVAPNTIDFSSVFLKFSPLNQAAVMGTLGGIFLIYVLAVLFLIGLDRRDILKWGVTPLRDNIYGVDNYYIIKVYTGMRRGAGTTSRVAFILTGYAGDSGPREMFDGMRLDFSTGSVRSFFMTTKKHLGTLLHLYIWHDNSGQGDESSWYVNQVVIYDIKTQKTYTFAIERWLSADTSVDTEVKGTSPDNTVDFESRFFFQTRDRLSESHMWISILYRPQTSTFTRVQRVSCALVYIMLTMIANAMYFNPESEYESAPLIKAGPFRFSLQQIYISIICALITTPPVMLLIFLFKRTRRKPAVVLSETGEPVKQTGCCRCACPCGPWCQRLFRTRKGEEEKAQNAELRKILLSAEIPDFKSAWYLPHWCFYFAWLLVLAGTVVPGFFIVLFSIEWGKQKSEEWLTTLVLSLLQSILLVDPFMVLLISLVLACLIRKPQEEENVDVGIIIENYKKYQGRQKENFDYTRHVLQSIKDDLNKQEIIPLYRTPPIKGNRLREAAEEYQHHKKMTSTMFDLCISILLMLIIFTICYGNRDDRSYMHTEFLQNQLVDPNYGPITLSPRFYSIKTHGDLFDWVNHTVFPSLFPENDMNGAPLHWSIRQYMNAYYNFRLGPPRLRQLRTTEGICDVPRYGKVNCYGKYTFGTEDTRDFCIDWTLEPCPVFMTRANFSLKAWRHESALDIWGMPIAGDYNTYGGGGYLATFDVNLNTSIKILNELYGGRWLDRQTRAVFLEFTLYCATTNLFIYNIFLVEFPETGGAFKTHTIYPFRVYTHSGAVGMLTLICEVIFVIYVCVLFGKICVRIYQMRCGFFKNFWMMIDFIILLLGLGAIVAYVFRMLFTNSTIERFNEDKKLFVNFSHIVLWDQILITLLAFMVFLVTLRILEVFGTAKKVQAAVKVFEKCKRDLISFSVMFFFIFTGFSFLGHLVFGRELESYSSIYNSMVALFLRIFFPNDKPDTVLSKVIFSLYTVVIIFFVLTIFMAILGESIDSAVQESKQDKRQDIIDFMIAKFRNLISKPTPNRGGNNRATESKPSTKKHKKKSKKKSKEGTKRPQSYNDGSIQGTDLYESSSRRS